MIKIKSSTLDLYPILQEEAVYEVEQNHNVIIVRTDRGCDYQISGDDDTLVLCTVHYPQTQDDEGIEFEPHINDVFSSLEETCEWLDQCQTKKRSLI